MRIGNVPTSTLNDADNILFAEGEAPRKVQYSDMKADMLGTATLATTAPKPKEAINEINQGLLDTGGYGVISGGVVTEQSAPNMTVQVSECTLKTATGKRQIATANTALTIATADITNPRIDIIYVNSSGVISYLEGTVAESPTVPSTPTGGSLLAQINIAANQTTIANSNIVDGRKILISTDWLNTQLLENTQNIATNTSAIATINTNKAPLASPNFTGTPTVATKTVATTESVDLTLLNGWIANLAKVTKSGNIVTLNFRINNGTMTSGTIICNIPSGNRPLSAIYVQAINPYNVVVGTIGIDNSTGDIIMNTAFTSNSDINIHVSYQIA